MALKRAVQLLSLRTTCTILRSQCAAVPRHITSRTVPRTPKYTRPHIAFWQRRWNSAAAVPQEKSSKGYTFEDIQTLVSQAPSPKPSSPLLIDVREPHEYTPGHIPGAINIPITSQPDALLLGPEDFLDRFGFEKPGLEREVVFYCKAGVRGRTAASLAKMAGYREVGEYEGSWLDWVRRGGTEES